MLLNVEKLITSSSEILSNLIFLLIGSVIDKKRRNRLIKLRRDIFNQKINSSVLSKENEIDLPNTCRFVLSVFIDAFELKQKLISRLEKTFSSEEKNIRNTFKSLIKNQDFQKGLLLSSHSLYENQNYYIESNAINLNRKQEQIERGLLRYYTRMVMKATPFGTFCSICTGRIFT